ncbi:MAG: hypothetical protein EOS12_28635 [Mesorhizobium sp.]|nr:MAG: hypothetical protein EOS12_28635 [Mesorhizobium sp.]
MPNHGVRAAAEGMPNVNRRNLLLGAAAISTAAAVVAVSPAAHAAPTSLEEAIAACQRAEQTYVSTAAREKAIADALGDKLFPKWTPPGGLSSIWSHHPKAFRSSGDLEAEIARKKAQVEESWASSCMDRAGYNRWMAGITSAETEGLTSLREQEAVLHASGHHDAMQQADDAIAVWNTAFQALIRHPCVTMAEVRAKAAALIHGYGALGVAVDDVEFIACLSSFCGEG